MDAGCGTRTGLVYESDLLAFGGYDFSKLGGGRPAFSLSGRESKED